MNEEIFTPQADPSYRPRRVVVLYRVLQTWRVPVFQRLAETEGIQLHVVFGEDYEGSKIINHKGTVSFPVTQLKTLKFQLRTRNGVARVPIQVGLWRELRRLRPDVIICEGASHLVANVTAYIYSKIYCVPQIQWGLGLLRGRRKSRMRLLADFLFFRSIERSARAVIAYSSFSAAYYEEIGLPASSIFVAVNSVDTDRRIREMRTYCTENGLHYPPPIPQKFKVAFIGAMTEGKSVDLLIKAFERLAHVRGDAELVLIGDGDDRKRLERMAEACGLGTRIFFAGQRLGSIADLLFDASVVVLPGLGGLAISDGMAHGLPVICHSGDGTELDLVDGTNGRVLDVMTPDILFEELLSLSNDLARQTQWRTNAQRTVLEKCGINTYVTQINRAIAHCLSGRDT